MAVNRYRAEIDLPDEAATECLAEDVAACLAVGDVVALSGGLGAGKTVFARAVVRALADDPDLEVPSPTFTLMQTYGSGRIPVGHFDLYRLTAPEEVEEIGLDDALAVGAVVIEWPEHGDPHVPQERLSIRLKMRGRGRLAVVEGGATWAGRLTRSRAARSFIELAGWSGARRRHVQGDASTRRYERIFANRQAVLMDWPPDDSPPDPRARHRARDVATFVAVGDALAAAGFSVPEVFSADYAAGFLLLEDFGRDGVASDGAPVVDRYRAALDVLAAIHAEPRPPTVRRRDRGLYRLPVFSAGFAAEVSFFTDWYLADRTGRGCDAEAVAEFSALWQDLTADLRSAETSWVLLDFHSPNLLWLPDRRGVRRVGLLDFQDMHFGPAAYDVASLCQDARVTIPEDVESALCDHYVARRRSIDSAFDAAAFANAYTILAAQRVTKILGVFARLARAYGKPGYRQHFPRLREYLDRSLARPPLSRYALWCERHLPGA